MTLRRRPDQRDRRAPRHDGEGGFALIQQLVAITIIFAVLLSLLGALGTAVVGVSYGRQKAVATSLAKQILETWKGAAYATVGLNIASPGLAADSRVTGTSPNLSFEGEPLVAVAAPVFPNYSWTTVQSGVSYNVSTFVTTVSPSGVAPYRRLTVFVQWLPGHPTTSTTLRFSTLVSSLDYTSFPAAGAYATSAGGLLSASGTLAGQDIGALDVTLPGSRSFTSESTLRNAFGLASGPSVAIEGTPGPFTATGCTAAVTSTSALCTTTPAQAVADNDAATSADQWANSPTTANSAITLNSAVGTIAAGAPAATRQALSTTNACTSCWTPTIGDNDGHTYQQTSSSSTSALTATFASPGILSGRLWQLGSGWATSTNVDQDASGGGSVVTTAQLSAPTLNILPLDLAPAAYLGAAVLPAWTATAAASAGVTSATVGITGAAFTVKLWDPTQPTSYRSVPVTPGVAADVTTTGAVTSGTSTVTLTTHLVSQAQSVTSTAGSPRTRGQVQAASLLTVTVTAVVAATVAAPLPTSLTVSADLGQLEAETTWQLS